MTENDAIEILKDEHSYGYELNKACLIAIKALEKQIPKKMDRYYCTICRHYFEDGESHNYCPECGQKLDWE